MDDLAIVLRLDLSDTAPEGPGWYIYATDTGEHQQSLIINPHRVSGKSAVELAVRLQQIVGPPGPNERSPTQIVGLGNQQVVQRINDQIRYAEDQAKRIGQLRRILQTESEQGE